MKIFSVFGISGTGKTTTIECIIQELKKRRYSVGSIKEIHFEDFAIDTPGSNTDRHSKAGAEPVTARGYYETDILYKEKLELEKILYNYEQDYVVIEGIDDGNFPKIITAKATEEIEERLDDSVFAICGKISSELEEYSGLPVIDARKETERLVDLIEERVYEKLPDFSPDCCTACGYSCRELGNRILKGKSSRDECIINDSNVKVYINEREIDMVPFVQRIIYGVVNGLISNLDGYQKGSSIKISIGDK